MSNGKVSYWKFSVVLAGFLFGFDTDVISGAILPIKELWNTSPAYHAWFIKSIVSGFRLVLYLVFQLINLEERKHFSGELHHLLEALITRIPDNFIDIGVSNPQVDMTNLASGALIMHLLNRPKSLCREN